MLWPVQEGEIVDGDDQGRDLGWHHTTGGVDDVDIADPSGEAGAAPPVPHLIERPPRQRQVNDPKIAEFVDDGRGAMERSETDDVMTLGPPHRREGAARRRGGPTGDSMPTRLDDGCDTGAHGRSLA